jgi:hypothetical protein
MPIIPNAKAPHSCQGVRDREMAVSSQETYGDVSSNTRHAS